jgi:hypothetical protein
VFQHVAADEASIVVGASAGCLFISNQAAELSSPIATMSLSASVGSLVCVQIHASHLILGTSGLIL